MTPEDDAVDLLTRLVAVPSPSGYESEACELLVSWMRAQGYEARRDEVGNAVGVRGSGDQEILLLGHIDTFPGAVPVRREGALLYGRGTVDAKGPLCAFAAAAANVSVPRHWRITVVGAVEEEAATSRGARHVLASRLTGAQPGPPVCCVIGEPSRWDRVTLGYRGRLVLDLALRAPFAHSAGPQQLPAERGVELWTVIGRYCRDGNATRDIADGAFGALSPSLRRFVTVDEGAFGAVNLSIGIRVPLGSNPATVERELVERLAGCVGDDRGGAAHERLGDGSLRIAAGDVQLTIRARGREPAFRAGKSNPLVRAFLGAIRAHEGTPRFVLKTGTSDMNVVGPHWPNTPIVAYGAGDSSLDHTPGEHVNVREFVTSVTILRAVLRELLGTERRAP